MSRTVYEDSTMRVLRKRGNGNNGSFTVEILWVGMMGIARWRDVYTIKPESLDYRDVLIRRLLAQTETATRKATSEDGTVTVTLPIDDELEYERAMAAKRAVSTKNIKTFSQCPKMFQ